MLLNNFALREGSLIFCYNWSSKFIIFQCVQKYIRTHSLCIEQEYQNQFLSCIISRNLIRFSCIPEKGFRNFHQCWQIFSCIPDRDFREPDRG